MLQSQEVVGSNRGWSACRGQNKINEAMMSTEQSVMFLAATFPSIQPRW